MRIPPGTIVLVMYAWGGEQMGCVSLMSTSIPISVDRYAAARSQQALGKTCPGLHFPDVLAAWGFPESADGVNADAGLMSNGPCKDLDLQH